MHTAAVTKTFRGKAQVNVKPHLCLVVTCLSAACEHPESKPSMYIVDRAVIQEHHFPHQSKASTRHCIITITYIVSHTISEVSCSTGQIFAVQLSTGGYLFLHSFWLNR